MPGGAWVGLPVELPNFHIAWMDWMDVQDRQSKNWVDRYAPPKKGNMMSGITWYHHVLPVFHHFWFSPPIFWCHLSPHSHSCSLKAYFFNGSITNDQPSPTTNHHVWMRSTFLVVKLHDSQLGWYEGLQHTEAHHPWIMPSGNFTLLWKIPSLMGKSSKSMGHLYHS